MPELSRRELLAWLAAGSATAAAGWSLTGGTSATPGAAPSSSSGAPGTSVRPGDRTATGSDTASSPTRMAEGSAAGPSALADPADRVLVVVEMGGGNDGLSTVVPMGLPGYYESRSATALDVEDLIGLDDDVAFHPNLERVAARGAAIVQGIGSPTPDGSHFEMLQRWWRGTPEAAEHGPGWIGRLADVMGDPDAMASAVSIGSGTHPIIASRSATTLALPDARAAWYLAGGDDGVEAVFQRGVRSFGSGTGTGDGAWDQVAAMAVRTSALAEQLIADEDEDAVEYPGGQLGDSLAFARRLITLDVGVRVVHVVMNGDFDTHEGHAGRHAELMSTFDGAVGAFWDDVDASGLADRVLLMTTSEFGRTMQENGSAGLDHGTASTALVMGPVEPERLGEHPDMRRLDDNDDLVATAPFDAYLGAVVERWFDVPAGEVFESNPDLLDLRLV